MNRYDRMMARRHAKRVTSAMRWLREEVVSEQGLNLPEEIEEELLRSAGAIRWLVRGRHTVTDTRAHATRSAARGSARLRSGKYGPGNISNG